MKFILGFIQGHYQTGGNYMVVKDPDIYKIIDKIKDHYNNNIYNRYIRKALLTMKISQNTWDQLDSLSEKAAYYKVQGYQFDELYDRIIAAATFIFHARKEVLPNLSILLAGGTDTVFTKGQGGENTSKILTQMAINNFPVNLKIFSDMVNELYLKTVDLDKKMHKGEKSVYERIPELKEMGHYLVTE
jgi:hypothetical protein